MKTLLRDNKLRLFLLGVPVLCLIFLWNINIYRIWYNYTNWRNLGPMPHATAVKIVDFHAYYFWGVLALGDDGGIYFFNQYTYWSPGHLGPFGYSDSNYNDVIQQKRDCAAKLQSRWGFKDHYFQDVKSVDMFGYCTPYVFDYAVFQTTENGEVWEKYFESSWVDRVRNRVTLYFCIFLILTAPIWVKLFVDYDPLKLKPDYGAK